jgi:small conductance mechanosensitive channel
MDEELQQIEVWKDQLILYLVENGFRLLLAVAILAAGIWLGKTLSRILLRLCDQRGVDVTLARFLAGFTKLLIVVFAGVMALSKAGIEITPFIALIGAGAFGLSLAVQGPISNYGAGIVLIVTRPFKVGDTLTLGELTGVVDSVNLGNTQLLNEDEERITIPNRKVLGEIFINSNELTVVESVVGIDYGDDPEKAIAAVSEALAEVPAVAKEKTPEVGIEGFGDSSVDIGYRYWVLTSKLPTSRYAANLAVWKALKQAGISIPFPQRDVHLIPPPGE